MGKRGKKNLDEKVIALALITASVSLLEKLIDLIIKILDICGGN